MPINPELSATINILVNWVIPIAIAAGGTLFVYKIYGPLVAMFRAYTTAAERRAIALIFDEVTRAADATRLRQKLEGQAWDALGWAVEAVTKRLSNYGIVLDREEIIAGIRAALTKIIAEWPNPESLPASGSSAVARGVGMSSSDLKSRLWA